jgi:hypothetical protein
MKFNFTLLVILFTGLKISAAVHKTDTVKLSSPSNHLDSLKLPGNHEFSSNRADSLDFAVAVLHRDSLTLQAYMHHPENINLSAMVKYADSVSSSSSGTLSSDSLYRQIKVRNQDSLKQLAVLVRMDSVKFATYRLLSDSVKQQLKSMGLDSLKRQLSLAKNDWFKGQIYTEIASRYLVYDTLSNVITRLSFQNKALNFTMLALHQYSLFNDTTGLRICFDNLAKVYIAQKKYSEAKWFILQSNTLSRAKKDVPGVITSLLTLSSIKSEIKDYSLAMKDLNEAMQLSVAGHYPQIELDVLHNYAMLYSRLKNYPKEALVLKKRDSLVDSIRKDEEAKLMATANAQALLQKKKIDSIQNKKKVYTSSTRKLYKNNSSRKIASL